MIDREKVIKGLTHCTAWNGLHECQPKVGDDCPYEDEADCKLSIMYDALALLKEQKAEAKWIYGEDETGVDGWYCSECNFFEPWFYEFTEDIDFIRFYGHCPKCGRSVKWDDCV